MENKVVIKYGELVMLRLPNDLDYSGRQRHYNTWFRVKFIDNDGTFIGEMERYEWGEFELYSKGEQVKLSVDKVLQVYNEGDQFCYGDRVTICRCEGLCRNK